MSGTVIQTEIASADVKDIVLVHSDEIVMLGIKAALEQAGFAVYGSALTFKALDKWPGDEKPDAIETLERLYREGKKVIVLGDLRCLTSISSMDRLAQCDAIKKAHPNARMIGLDSGNISALASEARAFDESKKRRQLPVVWLGRPADGWYHLIDFLQAIVAREAGNSGELQFPNSGNSTGYLATPGLLLHHGYERGGI